MCSSKFAGQYYTSWALQEQKRIKLTGCMYSWKIGGQCKISWFEKLCCAINTISEYTTSSPKFSLPACKRSSPSLKNCSWWFISLKAQWWPNATTVEKHLWMLKIRSSTKDNTYTRKVNQNMYSTWWKSCQSLRYLWWYLWQSLPWYSLNDRWLVVLLHVAFPYLKFMMYNIKELGCRLNICID